MKRIIAILLALLLLLTACQGNKANDNTPPADNTDKQPDNTEPVKEPEKKPEESIFKKLPSSSILKYEGYDQTYNTYYSYDNEGNLVNTYSFSEGKLSERETLHYKDGKISSITYDSYMDEKIYDSYEQYFTYDDEGNKILSTEFSYKDEQSGQTINNVFVQTIKEINGHDYFIKEEVTLKQDGKVTYEAVTDYEYEYENGVPVRGHKVENGSTTDTYEYEYDPDGHLVKETTDYFYMGETYVYKYNYVDGLLASMEEYVGDSLSSTMVYTYEYFDDYHAFALK